MRDLTRLASRIVMFFMQFYYRLGSSFEGFVQGLYRRSYPIGRI